MIFNSLLEFTEYLRSNQWIPDDLQYVWIGKKVYTLHDYDIEGHKVQWANKRYSILIQCITKNRHISTDKLYVIKRMNYKLLKDNINYLQ